MDIENNCERLKQEVEAKTTRSQALKIRVSPVTVERIKKTASELNLSINSLINYILGEVLL